MWNLSTQDVLGIFGMIGALILWLVRLERRLNQALTIQEHRNICEKHHIEIKDLLEGVTDRQDKMNDAVGGIQRDFVQMQLRMERLRTLNDIKRGRRKDDDSDGNGNS